MTRYYSYRLADKRCIIKHDEGKGGVIIHLDKYRVNLVVEMTIKYNYLMPENFEPKKFQWSKKPVIIVKHTTEKLFKYWLNHVKESVDGKMSIDHFLFGNKDMNLDLLRDELHSLVSRYVPPTKTPAAHSKLNNLFRYVKSFNYELTKTPL